MLKENLLKIINKEYKTDEESDAIMENIILECQMDDCEVEDLEKVEILNNILDKNWEGFKTAAKKYLDTLEKEESFKASSVNTKLNAFIKEFKN